jgi:hypothetical protein
VDVERTTSKYTMLIEHLSSFTHINATTFGIKQSAERKLAQDALKTFSLVLKTIDDCRSRIMSKVEDLAQDVLTENMLERRCGAPKSQRAIARYRAGGTPALRTISAAQAGRCPVAWAAGLTICRL